MYSVTVRHSALVAYALKGEQFGPAQNLHGATLLVDVEFMSERLNEDNTVIDIVFASHLVEDVLSHLNYRNLNEMEEFAEANPTIEYVARYIHREVVKRVRSSFRGQIKVTIHETDRAWASFTE